MSSYNICKITGWNVGHAYIVSNDDNNKLTPSDIWHLDHPRKYQKFCAITKQKEIHYGECLPGRVLQTGKPVWIDNIRYDKNFPRAKLYKSLSIKSAFGLPVKFGNKVIVVLEFFNNKEIAYDQDFMKVITILSDTISKAYEKKEMEALLSKKTAQLEVINKEMELLAWRDPLTHLLNRRSFEQEATRVLNYSRRHNTITAVLYADIDDFKKINDNFGHNTGDVLLCKIADRIKEVVRKEDLVARFGGDEFVIFLSHIKNNDEISKIAKKILKSVSKSTIVDDNHIIAVTISIGIEICSNLVNLSGIIRSADEALYESKKAGKARYVINTTTVRNMVTKLK